MSEPFGPSMRIGRFLPEAEDVRNQWFRAEPLRKVHAHVSRHGARLADVHFSDSQQLFGPPDLHRIAHVVTWTGRVTTPEGVTMHIAVGGGLPRSGHGSARMHAIFTVDSPGKPTLSYYACRPEQGIPYAFHPIEPDQGVVLQDVSEEEGHALASILACFGPRHLPIPPHVEPTEVDRAVSSQRRRIEANAKNRAFAQDFRRTLLGWFKENAPQV